MKPKIICFFLAFYGMVAVSALAADWVPFFKHPQNNGVWVYDREGINYIKEKEYLLGMITFKDKNFPKVWFKSVQAGKERRLLIEMDCNGQSGSLYDDTGNAVYADKEVDYMYGHQFRPDSVLMALHTEVCLSKSETDKK